MRPWNDATNGAAATCACTAQSAIPCPMSARWSPAPSRKGMASSNAPIRRLPTGSSAFSALCCRMAIRSPSDIEASAAVRTVSSDVSSIVTKSPRSRLPDRIAAAISAAPRAPKTSAAIETASISVPASLTCRASSSSASTGSVMPLPARLPRPIFMPARAASMFTPPFSNLPRTATESLRSNPNPRSVDPYCVVNVESLSTPIPVDCETLNR